jgi:farnesyl-diphosphate farnesyltransferase
VAAPDLLTTVLRDVSRSFYLTMRVLPGSIRRQIGLAYLLARTTDTIADTEIVPVERRLTALHDLRDAILGVHSQRLDFSEFVQAAPGSPQPFLAHCEGALRDIEYNKLTDPTQVTESGSDAERTLLQRIDEILAVLAVFTPDDQQRIHEVLKTITSGQELDLQRFGRASAKSIVALERMEELDDYTYRVAGCVGEFWTRMCRAHVFPQATLDDQQLLRDGIRFGKGLQLVNVLRDLPADLRHGRCYLPHRELGKLGLAPADLLHSKNEARLRPLYNELLRQADEHLRAGWNYTNSLPRSCIRVRLACAWPILIGVRTLARLRTHNVLDGAQRIKISRREVKGIFIRSIATYPSTRSWNQLYERAAQTEGAKYEH